jgi:hypothetical protein
LSRPIIVDARSSPAATATIALALDQPSSSRHTRDVLGWRTTHPGLLDDLENLRP